MARRENFGLRERLSRDGTLILKYYLFKTPSHRATLGYPLSENGFYFDDRFITGVNLVYTFSKFYPQYLV